MSAIPAPAERGTPILGPVAVDGNWRRFWYLTWTLAVTEFKLRFFGSVLGYLWQLIRPLLLFGVLFVVFTEFVRIGGGVKHYPIILLMGIVLYTFFQEATMKSVESVLDNENLVRKIQFPRLVIPLSVVLVAFFNLCLNLIAIFIFLAIQGVDFHLTWFQLPGLLILLLAFATGMAMILSSLFVRFRDIKPIWEVVLQVLFYATPILYPIELVPTETAQRLMMINPLAAIIQQLRHAVIDPGAPGTAAITRGWGLLIVPAALVILALVVGYWIFRREAPRIAEEL